MKNLKEKIMIFTLAVFMFLAVLLMNFIEGGYLFPQFYGAPGSGEQDVSLKAYEESMINKALQLNDAAEGSKQAPAAVSLTGESKLMVGGASLGIIMRSNGVMVVGYSAIDDGGDKVIYPAKEAGIALGDSVLAINGTAVSDDEAMLELINSEGAKGDLTLTIRHGSQEEDVVIKPYFCQETSRYRIGLYVRDNMGGVGTLTFYDPATKRFGALGHPIEGVTEDESQNILGHALPSAVRSIKKATKGETGEKIGYFEDGDFDGTIDSVGNYGIYGTMAGVINNPLNTFVYPAAADEVEEGKAQIVTVVDGNTPEFFDVEITKVEKDNQDGKGLSLKITDKTLLSKTGGIIQGMSGSPIIQNNKLVGAVTYVTVNEPEEGYGCLIEFMLDECNLN